MKLLPTLLLALALPAAAAAVTLVPATSISAPAQAANFTIDGGHSSVLFRIKHFGVSNFYGRFNSVKGEIAWDAKNVEKSSISIEIDAASVDSNSKDRDQHLRGPTFLSAKEFPTLTFKSKSVKKKGEQFEVTGDFTMRGVTKSITTVVDFTGEGETVYGYRAGFETSFDIKRADFGVSDLLEGLSNDVRITVALEATKK